MLKTYIKTFIAWIKRPRYVREARIRAEKAIATAAITDAQRAEVEQLVQQYRDGKWVPPTLEELRQNVHWDGEQAEAQAAASKYLEDLQRRTA